MAWTKEDRSFKILINKRETSSGKAYYEEFSDKTINFHASELWSDYIDPIPANAVTAGVATMFTKFVLTEDLTVGGHMAWYAYGELCSPTPPSIRLEGWISNKYAPTAAAGTTYDVLLYDSNDVQIFPTDPSGWFFDFPTGVLTFTNSPVAYTPPFKITGYVYIGAKGAVGTQGATGLQGLANFTDATSFPPIVDPPELFWNDSNEALYAGVSGIGGPVWIQISSAALQGTTGSSGDLGSQGTTGVKGATGLAGVPGATGIQGIQGNCGPQGSPGNQGNPGVTGPQGATGVEGATGLRGYTGLCGATGIQGTTGASGIAVAGETNIFGGYAVRSLSTNLVTDSSVILDNNRIVFPGSIYFENNTGLTYPITGAPPYVGTNTGWKETWFADEYALGIASYTVAVYATDTANGGWLSGFWVPPANNANPGAPDTSAAWSLNCKTGNTVLKGDVAIGGKITVSGQKIIDVSATAIAHSAFVGWQWSPAPSTVSVRYMTWGNWCTVFMYIDGIAASTFSYLDIIQAGLPLPAVSELDWGNVGTCYQYLYNTGGFSIVYDGPGICKAFGSDIIQFWYKGGVFNTWPSSDVRRIEAQVTYATGSA